MSNRLVRPALPWVIVVVAVLAAAAAGIAYATNPTQSRPGPPAAYAEINADGTLLVDDSGPDAGLPRVKNIAQANEGQNTPGRPPVQTEAVRTSR